MRARRRISIASSPLGAVSKVEVRPQNVGILLVVDDQHGAVVVGRRLGRRAPRTPTARQVSSNNVVQLVV